MLYLIGLGLNVDGVSKYGLGIIQKCKRVYLEGYTVDFPYNKGELEQVIDKKVISVDRDFVEGLEIVDEAQKLDVALLIYGSPLTATTHISLIQEAKRCGVRYKVVYNASILDAVAETGLQLYKFGKIASMPKWDKEKSFTPDSFIKTVQENNSIQAHSLILVDIGFNFQDALNQLESATKTNDIKLKKIVVCSKLGTKSKRIIYRGMEELLKEDIDTPFCFIIPSKLHFIEKEVLEQYAL
jgi:diphthine synthase